jgi:ElaB/YqjD/DUF883 family membrane-anchored ribosome-binding protein
MSKQADQEKQQAESLTSSEGYQSLLTEQEASQQELVELSGEQLMEVAGGVLPTREQVNTALKHVGIAAACCAAGAAANAVIGAAAFAGDNPQSGAKVGAAVGAGIGLIGWTSAHAVMKCMDCYHDRTRPQTSARVTPVGDVELGHAQHHG